LHPRGKKQYCFTYWLLYVLVTCQELSEWRSGKIDRCSKLTSALVTSDVVGSIPGQTHSSCDRFFFFGMNLLPQTYFWVLAMTIITVRLTQMPPPFSCRSPGHAVVRLAHSVQDGYNQW
jgi:hypothetical protein